MASGLSFELLGFAGAPVTGEVVVLELEGRFRAASRRRLGHPRLLVEHPDGARELPPASGREAIADPDGALWRASWALDLGVLEAGSFSLAVGRQLVELPAPDLGDPEHDRDVRLAREANALRRTIDEAREAAAAALASAADERRVREAAEAEAAAARQARDDLNRRLTGVENELTEARREHAAELVRRDEARDAENAERDQQAIAVADERVAIVEAEAAEARRALKGARAETEAVRRELERERERIAVLEAALPRGRVTELDGERIEGEDADRPTTRIAGEDVPAVAATAPIESEDLPRATDPEAALAAAREEADRPAEAQEDGAGAPTTVHDPAPVHEHETSVAPAGGGTATFERGESVRVLGTPRPRRTAARPRPETDVPENTAEVGARHIEPGEAGPSAAWLARTLAIAALAVVAVALLVLLKFA
ncbi:MAG: hypothetical protein ACXVFT_01490 [Solirubrobacteraceae bacterium]